MRVCRIYIIHGPTDIRYVHEAEVVVTDLVTLIFLVYMPGHVFCLVCLCGGAQGKECLFRSKQMILDQYMYIGLVTQRMSIIRVACLQVRLRPDFFSCNARSTCKERWWPRFTELDL